MSYSYGLTHGVSGYTKTPYCHTGTREFCANFVSGYYHLASTGCT